MSDATGTPARPGPGWIAGLIVAALIAILAGASVGMLLLIGIAMGGDALGLGYAQWATAAMVSYPILVLALVIFALVWGVTARGPSVTKRCVVALVVIVLAVPIGTAVALGLTSLGISLNQ